VVFCLPGDELSRIGSMAASWGAAVCQQACLAREGRLQLAIHDADGSAYLGKERIKRRLI
jgi:hypothetical protein